MSFVRPEVREGLWRWREVLAGGALLGLAVYWFLSPGLLHWIAFPILAIALALIATGIPRARFRGPGGGPGIVQIVEGQISYFGPLTGGVVDVGALQSLALDATGRPAHWVLRDGAAALHIPVTAAGVDGLFEALQRLPGLSVARLAAARQMQTGHHIIWRKPGSAPSALGPGSAPSAD